MYFDNLKHIIPFLIIGSFIIFIIGAILSSFFIIVLPLADDWCKDGGMIQVGTDDYEYMCFEYKNEAEMIKHYHNKEMQKRNKYLIGIEYAIAYFLTSICFCFIPKLRKKINIADFKRNLFISLMVAFGISIIGSLFYSWILPAPVEWFPSIFRDMHNEKVDNLLRYINY